MKKTYNNPEIEMLAINTIDVIASSGDIEEKLGGTDPKGYTVDGINGLSEFVYKSVPITYRGGINATESGRVNLLYWNDKPLYLSVTYYLDGVQIGEVEWYKSGDNGPQTVTIKPLPEYENMELTDTVWEVKCFDPLSGNETNTSAVYGNLYDGSGSRTVSGNPGARFTMPDRHIHLYAYTQNPKTSTTVEKIWDDSDNQDGVRPKRIEMTLSNGDTRILSPQNNWSATVEGLAKYSGSHPEHFSWDEGAKKWVPSVSALNEGLTLIEYYWTETVVPEGYTMSFTTVQNEDGTFKTIITNRYSTGKVNVSVTKAWEDADNQDGKRPTSVQVQLYANGEAKGVTVALDESNNWSYIWEGLDEFSEGEEIEYTVSEVGQIAGYTTVVTGSRAEGFVITNTHTPESTGITATKVWKDENNQDNLRKDVVLHLTRKVGDGAAQVVDGQDKTIPADATGDALTVSWNELPKYEDGVEIIYGVIEDAVDGYETVVTGSAASGYTVTNTHNPDTTEATVKKVWNDNGNQDGIRPTQIVVTLSNGSKVTLNEANNWSATITGLPANVPGQVGVPAVYTWQEPEVEGYVLSGNATSGIITTLTNTRNRNRVREC